MSVFFTQRLPKFEQRRRRLRQPDDVLCNIAAPGQANKHAGCEMELIVWREAVEPAGSQSCIPGNTVSWERPTDWVLHLTAVHLWRYSLINDNTRSHTRAPVYDPRAEFSEFSDKISPVAPVLLCLCTKPPGQTLALWETHSLCRFCKLGQSSCCVSSRNDKLKEWFIPSGLCRSSFTAVLYNLFRRSFCIASLRVFSWFRIIKKNQLSFHSPLCETSRTLRH